MKFSGYIFFIPAFLQERLEIFQPFFKNLMKKTKFLQNYNKVNNLINKN